MFYSNSSKKSYYILKSYKNIWKEELNQFDSKLIILKTFKRYFSEIFVKN